MKGFDYHESSTLDEAARLALGMAGEVRYLAGGTDLLVLMKYGVLQPAAVINLKKIPGLDTLAFNEQDGLKVGALVTWSRLLESKEVARYYPVLRQAAITMASGQIRNLATLAGNLCHASPAANGPIPLLLYQAVCHVHGPNGSRKIPVEAFFVGVQKNALGRGEILTHISIPPAEPGSRGTYYKFTHRRAMDLAIVGVGALVKVEDGVFRRTRLAMGAVGPVPVRDRKVESWLQGRPVNWGVIEEAAHMASRGCTPISDLRASQQYRRWLVEELTGRALKECCGLE
ncbi:MAG: xanthine dehydrogenase family protein subunit M [Desulfarculus sp.]|jgi:carbon-monoxide dehydrogenase medium subunit|nr:MAG: xanthine dehydrogenase family protein subunit M [Desulfarculus sp.]